MSSVSGRKILVTGGAGFIGSHTVDALLQDGARVVIVDELSTGMFAGPTMARRISQTWSIETWWNARAKRSKSMGVLIPGPR